MGAWKWQTFYLCVPLDSPKNENNSCIYVIVVRIEFMVVKCLKPLILVTLLLGELGRIQSFMIYLDFLLLPIHA